MGQLTLRLFGAPQVARDGQTVRLRFQKELALLIFLAMTERPHTRLALATLFWPEHDQSHALAALRRALHQMKCDVGDDMLVMNRQTVQLAASPAVQVDARAFVAALRQCQAHAHPSLSPLPTCIPALEAAIALYVDDFLAGFSLPDCPEFDEWQFFQREGLRAEYARVVATLAAYFEAQGDHAHAVGLTTRSAGSFDRPPTRYAQNGTTYLAYQTFGAGDVDMLMVGGFITHLEQLWEEPALVQFYQQLGEMARVIVFDKRGVGMSDRAEVAPSLEQQADDALAILRAADVLRAVVFAVSDGAATGIHLAVRHPERVAGLVIYAGQAKGVRDADHPWGLTTAQYQRWMDKLVNGWGGPINLDYFAPSRAQDPLLRAWWAQMQRFASSPGGVQAILLGMRDVDVRPLLPQIRVPTVILHRRGDRCVPVESGRYLARQIPHARYVELPGQDHWWWVGDARPIYAEIARFLRGLPQGK